MTGIDRPRQRPVDPGTAGRDIDGDLARSLSGIVSREAMKALADQVGAGDPARLADGWERRFIGDAARAEEAVELYRQLGFEVVADAVRPTDLARACKDCALLAGLRFKVIYTRERRGS